MSAPRPVPALAPAAPATRPEPFRGISLKPKDAIDPYQFDRFAPDPIGLDQFAVWCPHCHGALLATDFYLAGDGLYIEAVCFTCPDGVTGRPGLCKRFRLPLPWRPPPPTSGV